MVSSPSLPTADTGYRAFCFVHQKTDASTVLLNTSFGFREIKKKQKTQNCHCIPVDTDVKIPNQNFEPVFLDAIGIRIYRGYPK